MFKKTLTLWVVALGLLTLTGCSISFGGAANKPTGNDGGVFKSIDKGETWQAKVLIPTTSGAPASIATVNIGRIIFDPQDHQTIYLATAGSGLLYTYDGGDNWQIPRSQPTEMKNIEDAAVDPKDSCTVYVAATYRVYKTTTCSRDWKEIYRGTRTSDIVTAIAVDWYNPTFIYAGTSEGNLLKSKDRGVSWSTIKNTGNKIKKVMIDPFDSRIVYVITERNGIFKTGDNGVNWEEIRDALGRFNALEYRDATFSISQKNALYWASASGIIKSLDGGTNWEEIKLVTAANIRSIAVDPENSNGLYYATDNTFYKSLDGGVNWITKAMPTSRAGTALVLDPTDPKVLYLGVTKLTK